MTNNFESAEHLLITLNRAAWPIREACDILARAKQYLTSQHERQPAPYVLRVELAEAGKSTSRFDQ